MAIYVYELDSLGLAYKIINETTLETKAEIKEIIPLGKKTLIISNFELVPQTHPLSKLVSKRDQIEQHETEILRAFYGLEANELKGNLIIFESNSLGRTMKFSEMALSQGYKIVELRLIRNLESSCICTITGEKTLTPINLEEWGKNGNVSHILNPGSAIKKFFN